MDRRTYCGVVAIALAGCSDASEQSASGQSPDETTAATETREDEPDGERSFTTDSGLRLSVDRIEVVRDGTVTLGEDMTVVGRSGKVPGLVRLVAENTSDGRRTLPVPDQFAVEDDEGGDSDPYQVDFSDDPRDDLESTVSEPVSGPLFPPTDALAAGEEVGGWLLFGVTSGATAVTLTLTDGEGTVVTTWELDVEN